MRRNAAKLFDAAGARTKPSGGGVQDTAAGYLMAKEMTGLPQQKVSQELAKYQATPKDKQRCDGCASFQAPNACKVVEGDISPSGWCQLFVPKA